MAATKYRANICYFILRNSSWKFRKRHELEIVIGLVALKKRIFDDE